MISQNDNEWWGTDRSLIEWTASAKGTYYVRVKEYWNSAGDDYHYDLKITDITVPPQPDEYEDDDSYREANAITTDGNVQSHNFHDDHDNEDWVKFTAYNGMTYTIETLNLGNRCDTYLNLFTERDGRLLLAYDLNEAWWLIARYDDYVGTYAARLEWLCPETGTYYARVTQMDWTIYGIGTDYDLRILGENR